MDTLAAGGGRAGLGRVQVMDWLLDGNDESWPSILAAGWHHMGTLRMAENPKDGVVDANCKVHGLSNLYVAGDPVFSTSGAPNPTPRFSFSNLPNYQSRWTHS